MAGSSSAAELLAATNGLGFLLTDGQQTSRTDEILVAILLFAACGKLSESGMRLLEKRLVAGPTRCRSDVQSGVSLRNGESGRAHPRPAQGVRTHLVFDRTRPRRRAGERVAVLGASGARQVDLLRCIAGLERSDAGTIATAGEIGVMFQEPRLFPWLDVARNVGFPPAATPTARCLNVLALGRVGPRGKAVTQRAVGGMAQRRVAGTCARARSASAAADERSPRSMRCGESSCERR